MTIQRKQLWLWVAPIVVLSAMAFIPMPRGKPVPYHLDKLFHLMAYAAMMAVPTCVFRRVAPVVISAVFLVALGAGIELAQSFMPSRTASIYDMLFNVLGVALGWMLGWYWARRSKPNV
ncbi:MAG: VanZ family protein [Rickettsiales bacterium]|nr:VanZ family protein [Rickettsiales bacterium]